MKRFSEDIKKKVVEEILSGNMLLDEVIEKYQIAAKITVKRWLNKYQKNDGIQAKNEKK